MYKAILLNNHHYEYFLFVITAMIEYQGHKIAKTYFNKRNLGKINYRFSFLILKVYRKIQKKLNDAEA